MSVEEGAKNVHHTVRSFGACIYGTLDSSYSFLRFWGTNPRANLVTTHPNFNSNFRVSPGLSADYESNNKALAIPSSIVI